MQDLTGEGRELESSCLGDQRQKRVRQFIRENSGSLREQGAVVETWRTRAGRRSGPYFSLKFRVKARQRSLYLGTDQSFVDEVRADLARLQAPAKRRRWYRRQEQAIRRELARTRDNLRRELSLSRLSLKGGEIRGWRGANHGR